MANNSKDCNVLVIGAGPYGLSSAAYLRSAGVETRVVGDPMSFWEKQMPKGMFLRSGWKASTIADPRAEVTLDAYRTSVGNHWAYPVPLDRFVGYGHWYQKKLVPDVDRRSVTQISTAPSGFGVKLSDGETFQARKVVLAVGIGMFAHRPVEFASVPKEFVSHSADHTDLSQWKGRKVAVIGGGQSALESAALLHEAGAEVEVIARQGELNWVGVHRWLHKLGPISRMMYSSRDVGPAVLSRIVSAPKVLKLFPRKFQERASYRSIRPAGAFWLRPRLEHVPITTGRRVVSASVNGNQLALKLDDGSNRLVDHALLGTGYRVDISRYSFLSDDIRKGIETVKGFPVLKPGLESTVPGLHFLGRPAALSYGPLLCFVSGTEFAANELLRAFPRRNGAQ